MGKKVKLAEFAMARSGDKGTDSNIGIWVNTDEAYEVLKTQVTTDRVKEHFKEICFGEIIRYDMPNLRALNFIMGDALDGGGSASRRTDAQGKTHGPGLLLMEVEVPDNFAG